MGERDRVQGVQNGHWAVNYFANQSSPWVPVMKAVQTFPPSTLSNPPTRCQQRAGNGVDKQVTRLNMAGRIEERGVENKKEPVGSRK